MLTDPSDKAWPYSMSISLFNLLSFIYVLCAYGCIVWKVRRSNLVQQKMPPGSQIGVIRSTSATSELI